MDNSQLLVADGPNDRNVESVLDAIIQIKREGQTESSQTTEITDEDRIALLEKYKELETLKNRLNGRFLFEYDKGIKRLLKEVCIDA